MIFIKLWIDDVRPAPEGYVWLRCVNIAKDFIENMEEAFEHCTAEYPIVEEVNEMKIEEISIDHDAGDYFQYGGDFIRLLDWLEETGRSYPIHIHSMNPVGVENMRRIIQRNEWKEV